MKATKLIIIGISLLFAGQIQAQISVNLNIGTPPLWGPAEYTNVRYYYLPDVEAYYDVQSARFIYISGNTWVRRAYLPRQYRNYDLYNGYKVVMTDYRGNAPYTYYKEHKRKYAKGYHGEHQRTYGNRPEKGNGNRNGNAQGKKNGKGHKNNKH
ncbi:MAG: hypothetical protein CVU08_13735 [Bacteroidetes bacterium HGW-Bacteroidetes-3]|jgi:hypothetical protein|nr:MAG: hypothetical protein CVU08_13735 [Bacteroidetes bacterium HGW-Bacteroidetes-3]